MNYVHLVGSGNRVNLRKSYSRRLAESCVVPDSLILSVLLGLEVVPDQLLPPTAGNVSC